MRNLEEISESIHAKRKLTQSRQEGGEFDSLQYDLSRVHLDNDDVSVTSSQDTGLGSARWEYFNISLHLSSIIIFSVLGEAGEAGEAGEQSESGLTVERSISLPEFSSDQTSPAWSEVKREPLV